MAAFLDRDMYYEKAASMKRVHTHSTESVTDVTGYMRQPAWSEEVVSSLERMVKVFRKMLREAFQKHCSFGFYTLKYHLFDHNLENSRRFGTIIVLNSSPYQYFNAHIKQPY